MRCGSKQRDYLTEYIKNTRIHPTAQEIYLAVKAKFPNVSLGTVYRNLEYLLENNIIKKVQKAGGTDRYDYVKEHHNHAMCRLCGKIYDFCFPIDRDALQSAIGGEIVIDDTDFLVVGVCGKCGCVQGKDKLNEK